MIGLSLTLTLMLHDGSPKRLGSLGLAAGITAYTLLSICFAKRGTNESGKNDRDVAAYIGTRKAWLDDLFALAELGMLVVVAGLFVSGAVFLAQTFEVSQAVIGLTIVAVGKEAVLEKVAGHVDATPSFRLLTIVLGKNSITNK